MSVYLKKSDSVHPRLRVLFLPCDGIRPGISRSYYLAKHLAKFAEVYYLTIEDPRSVVWQNGSGSSINTLSCAAANLFKRNAIRDCGENGMKLVSSSMMTDAIFSKVFGREWGCRLRYAYNARRLRKLIELVKPDIVFHAENGHYFRPQKGDHITAWDLQDTLRISRHGKRFEQYICQNMTEDLANSDIAFAVSQAAAQSLRQQLGVELNIRVLENGADFEELRAASAAEVNKLRSDLGLQSKYILSYIGGEVWYDRHFAERLFAEAEQSFPEATFVIVGNVPFCNASNARFVGAVPPKVAAAYYQLSDVGVLLRNSKDNPFLLDSVPLKIIQYGAVRKPVITFPIRWCRAGKFRSVFTEDSDDLRRWVDVMIKVKRDFQWNEHDDDQWRKYSWDEVAEAALRTILSSRPQPPATRASKLIAPNPSSQCASTT